METEKLFQLKAAICWKTAAITNRFRFAPEKEEAEKMAKAYKLLANTRIEKKINDLNRSKKKVNQILILPKPFFCNIYIYIV